jgi:cell wall-associated NlpC family hydrolase
MGLVVVANSSCSEGFRVSSDLIARQTERSVACEDFKTSFYTALYRTHLDGQEFPDSATMRAAFRDSLETDRFANVTGKTKDRIADELNQLYSTLALEAPSTALDIESTSTLKVLAAMEVGDRTTAIKESLQDRQEQSFRRIRALVNETGVACESDDNEKSGDLPEPDPEREPAQDEQEPVPDSSPTPAPQPTPPVTAPTPPRATPTPPAATPTPRPPSSTVGVGADRNPSRMLASWRDRNPVVYGALKTFSTAYQSCEAAQRRPIINSSTPSARGISVVGTHSSGVGRKRVVSDVEELLRTHWYYIGWQKPGASCVQPNRQPLIYDYGGKPFASAEVNSELDMFRNAGSGTAALGIDCSAFVYSALASSGMKLKKDGRLIARMVSGVSSTMLKDPQRNGLTCLNHVRMTAGNQLKAGDIISIRGHVVLVEAVGADPLAINRPTSAAQCSGIRSSQFDFTIMQSSPSKGALGINRYKAADYLSGTMKSGLEDLAQDLCRARFGGGSVLSNNTAVGVTRHLGTPECLDRPVALAQESCLVSCEP